MISGRQLHGLSSNLQVPEYHTLASIVPSLELAAQELESENQKLSEEIQQLQDDLDATVSALSDLRYGKLANEKLQPQILEDLAALEKACK